MAIHEFYERIVSEIQRDSGFIGRSIVLGEGNADSPRLVFVGEAPGASEEREGRPFVGTAGKNLDQTLAALGCARERIFITNLVKVRPVKQNPKTGRLSNRPPTRDEAEFFTPLLLEELALLRPTCVVTLGNFALCAITGSKNATIGRMHGKLTRGEFNLFPLYHPAAAIYNRKLRAVMDKDVLELRNLLEGMG
ncbi:MAG: uracil-DNA glycosylase [Defluviitaleaceae bacterium]|nr:uracil-DNA glycosylase [Defluviitaleaceae bacterium]